MLVEALKAQLSEVQNIVLSETIIPCRGTINYNSLKIIGSPSPSHQDPSKFVLDYCYDWSAYRGCSGLDLGEHVESTVDFSHIGNEIIFEIEPRPPERPPNEEF